MVTRSQKIRLGVFVLVAMALVLALLVSVLGSTVFADRDEYLVRYDISVSGLEIGAPVKYNGVRVGRVDRLWIDAHQVSQTVVAISLQKATPVKENTRAVLNIQGITGLKFIELVGGTSDARTVDPGATIVAGTSVVDKLTGQAETLSIKAELLINQLLALTGDENRALVTDVLDRGGSLMNTLDKTVTRNADDFDKLVKSLVAASESLAAALEEIRRAAHETRDAVAGVRRRAESVLDGDRVAAVLDDTRAAIGEVRKRVGPEEFGQLNTSLLTLVKRLDELVGKADLIVMRSREDLRSSMRYLAETTENLRDFSRLIREDPSRLLRSQERPGRDLP
ncbi:MAG: MCE family protein [Deltaproteobacteria bacterium]|nr:MCE family protein [Deltaproteobacteria bacterium]